MTRIRSQIHPVESKTDDVGVQRPHLLSIPDVSHRRPAAALAPMTGVSTVAEQPPHSNAPVADVELPFTIHQQHVTEPSTLVRTLPRRAVWAAKWSKLTGSLPLARLRTRRNLAILVVLAAAILALALAGTLRPTRSSPGQGGVSATGADVRRIEHGQALPLRVETAQSEAAPGAVGATRRQDIFHVPMLDEARPESTAEVRSEEQPTPTLLDSRVANPRRAKQGPLMDPRQSPPAIVKNDPIPEPPPTRQTPRFRAERAGGVLLEESYDVASRNAEPGRADRRPRRDRSTVYETTDPSKYRYPHYSVPSMVRRQTTDR